eukprot:CAMPEP_0183296928 /NCGR_PEP_ID=MMETSP0160_2-20130417/4338_1 /TAXON_ID=2839 ORGANISM="Odontella Sinensis, Strain Grunow 1884" /NCGR_SAMPLE_ID=MMETSP0160_2 /ASSEMBLY_ACC=CAM_ASM_000250 /LENGTH=144 /DNA_ID=CAMNT_0025458633 /DNA_START=78 /DNA_END=512 /DNA_ORIENTATION=+
MGFHEATAIGGSSQQPKELQGLAEAMTLHTSRSQDTLIFRGDSDENFNTNLAQTEQFEFGLLRTQAGAEVSSYGMNENTTRGRLLDDYLNHGGDFWCDKYEVARFQEKESTGNESRIPEDITKPRKREKHFLFAESIEDLFDNF